MCEETLIRQEKDYATLCLEQRVVYSEFLERDVIIDVYLPTLPVEAKDVTLLLINDGQDLRKMDFASIIDPLIASGTIEPIMCVGLHCGADRMMEYGTVCRSDYRGRGARAGLYNKFIFDELLPFIRHKFQVSSFKEKSFAGFSLGGLSAMDIVWNHAHEFLKVGVFSGSLWWRRRGYDDAEYDPEKDKIMQLQVMKGVRHPWLKFFFQTGTLDETADRNNNGVIDSIDDALEMIEKLKGLGYSDEDIQYLQIEGGRHNVETWAQAFPEFLKWGWGTKSPLPFEDVASEEEMTVEESKMDRQ
jgi:enterochelin esterase-like enzyme